MHATAASGAGSQRRSLRVCVRRVLQWLYVCKCRRGRVAIVSTMLALVIAAAVWVLVLGLGAWAEAPPLAQPHADPQGGSPEGIRRLLVVSPGGVGTTHLMTQLQIALRGRVLLNSAEDFDDLKHGRPTPAYLRMLLRGECPRASGAAASPVDDGRDADADTASAVVRCERAFEGVPTAILYVFSDPLLAVKSLHRRGTLGHVLDRMHPRRRAALPADLRTNYTAYTAAVVAAGADLVGIEAHMQEWRQAALAGALPAPVLFADVRGLLGDPSWASEQGEFASRLGELHATRRGSLAALESLLGLRDGELAATGALRWHGRASQAGRESAAYSQLYQAEYARMRPHDGEVVHAAPLLR
jgi:hypothetical protein